MSVPAVFTAALGLVIMEIPTLEPAFLVAIIASFFSAYVFVDFLLRITRYFRIWSLCLILGAVTLFPQIIAVISWIIITF